jgi:hypothetical protein
MVSCTSCNIPFSNSEAKFCAICGTPAPGYSALQNPSYPNAPAPKSAWPTAEEAAAARAMPATTPDAAAPTYQPQPPVSRGFQSASQASNLSDSELLLELVRASNRTTHAIRALVRFFFIQLAFFTLAYLLNNISNAFIDPEECARYGDSCTGNGFFSFFSFVAIVAGIIISSRVGWAELKQSDVPKVNSGTTFGL